MTPRLSVGFVEEAARARAIVKEEGEVGEEGDE